MGTSKRSVEISSTPKKGVVADITAKDETNVVIEEKLGNGDAKVEDTKEEIKEIIKEGGEEKGEGDSKETETDDKTEEEKKKESKATNIKKKLSFKKSFSFLRKKAGRLAKGSADSKVEE